MDKKLVFIPNGKISDTVVTNYNAERQRKLVLKFTASYDDDIKKVKKALKEAVDSDERILEDPAPLINVSNYLESSIEYIVAVWVKSSDYWDVNWYLLEEVKHSFDRNNVTMTYNHINVHMVNE
jgi:small conductance mechanosensitive channel